MADLFQKLGYDQKTNRLKAWVENMQEVTIDRQLFLNLDIRSQEHFKKANVTFHFGEIKHFYDNLNQRIAYGKVYYKGRSYQATLYIFINRGKSIWYGELIVIEPNRVTMPC